jgi:hypothetical protein
MRNYQNIKIVNLTPHEVNIQIGGTRITFPPCGQVARVAGNNQQVGNISYLSQGIDPENIADTPTRVSVPVTRMTYGATEGLPPTELGTVYIVSLLVAQANPARLDLLVPDTSPSGAIRNAAGQIEAVRGFQVVGEFRLASAIEISPEIAKDACSPNCPYEEEQWEDGHITEMTCCRQGGPCEQYRTYTSPVAPD